MPVNEIINKIKTYETIIIHRHVRPDADALGSQNGLKEMIKQTFPQKNVYAVGEEDANLYFLARMDQISDEIYEDALVIVCDTANTARISDQRYKIAKEIIKIDHHPNHDQYGDLLWVDTTVSSTSEMIYELYKSGEQFFKINDNFARLIYAGIVGDTGRFLFPSTSNKTFRYAAELIQYNFDRKDLYNNLYRVSENMARLKGYILSHFEKSSSGASAVKLTKKVLDEYGVPAIDTGKLVGTLAEIDGMMAWVFFIEEDNIIRVRLRSKGPVINELAMKYAGGGHPMASGATVYSWEEAEQLFNELDELCKSFKEI